MTFEDVEQEHVDFRFDIWIWEHERISQHGVTASSCLLGSWTQRERDGLEIGVDHDLNVFFFFLLFSNYKLFQISLFA